MMPITVESLTGLSMLETTVSSSGEETGEASVFWGNHNPLYCNVGLVSVQKTVQHVFT